MGGHDKGLLAYHGKPLIEHVLERIPPGIVSTLISANRNLERYAAYGQVISDEALTYEGPLAGILAAMSKTNTPYLLTLPCDTPDLPPDLLPRLYQALVSEEAEIAVACSGERRHYVIALMKTTLRDDLQEFLDRGERKVVLWEQRHKVVFVELAHDDAPFRNINLPNELG